MKNFWLSSIASDSQEFFTPREANSKVQRIITLVLWDRITPYALCRVDLILRNREYIKGTQLFLKRNS